MSTNWSTCGSTSAWGPLFVPAYFAASLWQWSRGKHPYWDNPFEREAYDVAP